MKKLLIIKTGRAVEPLLEAGEDFENWIIAGSGFEPQNFLTVDVFSGESLPDLSDVQGIFITGSSAYVTDLAPWSERSATYLRRAVDEEVPILGICYGHQLLAHAFGGEVDFHPRGREIGTVSITLTEAAKDDPLLNQLPPVFPAQVSHQQTVTRLPDSAITLAFNDFESNHAFRLGRNVWGIQFHPEFSAATIAAYIDHRRQGIVDEGLDIDQLLKDIKPTGESLCLLRYFAELCIG